MLLFVGHQRPFPIHVLLIRCGNITAHLYRYSCMHKGALRRNCTWLASVQTRGDTIGLNECHKYAAKCAGQTVARQVHVDSAELQKAPTHDTCQAGMARTSLHMGDIKQGRALALGSNSPQLCKECAQILESQDKQQVQNKTNMFPCTPRLLLLTIPCKTRSLTCPSLSKHPLVLHHMNMVALQ